MPRAFNDLIVQEADGKPRLTFRSRQGTAVLEDVSVEVSSTVLQPGDAFGALAANLLLELDDDGVPYAVAPDFLPDKQPAPLAAREKLTAAFAKLAAAVNALITHLADSTRHITSAERTSWSNKYTRAETDAKLAVKAGTSGTYDGLTAGNSLRLGGKTLSMSMSGSNLDIWWQ